MVQVSASIVLFHNDYFQVHNTVSCFLKTNLHVKLYLIDNSSTDLLRSLASIDSRIEYVFNNANLGYGAAHNIAINMSIAEGVDFHLVLNPDVIFEGKILNELYCYMNKHRDVGNVMPLVKYQNGQTQYLCKLLPNPFDLFVRRFFSNFKFTEKNNLSYELRFSNYDKEMNVPSLSGCFMFIRISAIREVGLFDTNFFMYMEDLDLNRRIHSKYRTVFYPSVSITHGFSKDSYRNLKLLKYHIQSAIRYFNKWGWFFDKDRVFINNRCIYSLRNSDIYKDQTRK